MTTTVVRWRIPRQVWAVLMTWGLAVIVLAGLFSFWQYRQQEAAEDQARKERAEMCKLIDLIIGDQEPPAGPVGERARKVRAQMREYQGTLACPPRT